MTASDFPLSYNAVDILERNLPARQDKTALFSPERQLSFGQVAQEVNQVGHALAKLGVRFGDHVGILAPDCSEWVTAFFGAIKIGAIAVCLNTLLQPHEYSYILRDCRARVLIVHQDLLPAIESIRDQLPQLERIIVIGEPLREGDLVHSVWIAGESTALEAAPTHGDDFCSLHYSSGTTGEPKGILHAHKDYRLIAQLSGVELFGIGPDDRTFSAAKLFFVYGLGGNLIMPWYVGASVVLFPGSPRIVPKVMETIQRFSPTIFFGVPTFYAASMALKDLGRRYNLSSLRLWISAGEALPASTWHAWKDLTGFELLDTIGCTESLHTFMANRPGDIRPGSSGRPSPGYEVKLVDDEGVEVPAGTVGQLMVKGESIALFYVHQSQKSRHAFRGEWLFTGDRYYVDEDGYFWYVGRSDDMFKVGGMWVAPVELESRLSQHPAVAECAVVGKPDRLEMIRPHAFVCLRPEYEGSAELQRGLIRFCAEELPDYKCPYRIVFLDELPRTATGKVQRFKLRQEIHPTRQGERTTSSA
jgi:benzoate-CoA ligase family protein